MRHGSLFSGIGGFDLAAEWMGWTNVFNCEIDPFCRKVLLHHFPNSYQHEDIRTTDFTIWRNRIDLITGGFPCQPYSTAGKRKGKDDDRHLWPQMLRAIREISPSYVVGENVRGLVNWNGGLVFDEVQADLETEGYEVLPFLLPAAGVGAPHRRDRIWFVAFNSKFATYGGDKSGKGKGDGLDLGRHMLAAAEWQQGSNNIESSDKNVTNGANAGLESLRPGENKVYESGITSNTKRFGLPVGDDQQDRRDAQSVIERSYGIGDWKDFPTQSPVCNRNDGLSSGLVDITFSRWRKESIKALGNAIVPEVAFQIFKAIEQYNICQE